MPAQVHAPQAPSGVEMRIGTFEAFTAPTQQPLPARAANPPAVGIHGVTGGGLPAPVAPPTLWLRHVTAIGLNRSAVDGGSTRRH